MLGFLEGSSFVLLLVVAMPLKYIWHEPGAVRVIGLAHGVLFLLYVLAAIHAAVDLGWSWRRVGLLILAAFLPLGPFVADAKLLRRIDA